MSFIPNQGKQKQTTVSIASVLGISMVLLMLGFTLLLILNANKLSDSAQKNIGFTLFLDDKAKPQELTELQEVLKTAVYTESLKFIDKEKAAEEMKKELGEDFINFLGNNPLPNSFEVKVRSEFSSADSIAEIRTALSQFPIIKEFFWEQSLVKAINLNIDRFAGIALGLIIIVALISFLFIRATIRLSIIQNGVLNTPAPNKNYDIEQEKKNLQTGGLIAGLLSSSFASLVLVGLVYFLQTEPDGFFSYEGIWLILLIIFIFGTGTSGITAHFAVKRYFPDSVSTD